MHVVSESEMGVAKITWNCEKVELTVVQEATSCEL